LSSYQQEAPTGRVRKYYAITPRGRELLSEKKAEWAQFSHGVDQVLSFS
ncbi:MAG TPA: PadR family transcriptional regulator, partial [Candidatus Lawsonibacter pullicola]|nr:PadR family transcriptional regulator [Candidatus Lawsonibacter pullicola]